MVAGIDDSSCLELYTFFSIIVLQIVALIGYFTPKDKNDYEENSCKNFHSH
jgi:hypothetical protein